MISFDCPNCLERLEAEEQLAGEAIWCRGCRKRVTVPRSASPSESVQESVSPQVSELQEAAPVTPRWLAELFDQHFLRRVYENRWIAAACVGLLLLFVAGWVSSAFARHIAGFLVFTGIVMCFIGHWWALARAAENEPTTWLGLIIPLPGPIMIFRSREKMREPGQVFLVGIACLVVAVALVCVASLVRK